MNDLFEFLKKYNCIDIFIRTAGATTLTVVGDYGRDEKPAGAVYLTDIVYIDDFPALMDSINEFSAGSSSRMYAHFRMESKGQLHWVYICLKKADKDGFDGVMFDVYEYLESKPSDNVISTFEARQGTKISFSGGSKASLLAICGKDYLLRVQQPFCSDPELVSAIFDENEIFLCSPSGNPDMSAYKYSSKRAVRFAYNVRGYWVICSNNEKSVKNAEEYLKGMADFLSGIAHSIVALYNETENSSAVNKQLGENVEQQMLINSMQSVIMEETRAQDALTRVLDLAGKYLNIDSITAYGKGDGKYPETICRWEKTASAEDSSHEYMDKNYYSVLEQMGETEIFFSTENDPRLETLGLTAFALSKIIGNNGGSGLITFTVKSTPRIWSYGDRRIIRNIAQVISSIIFRCETEKRIEEKNRQLYDLAFFDSMLGIKNRAKLDIDLNEILKTKGSGAALAVQILNTRFLNEVFGQSYTDKLLRGVAQFLSDPEIGGENVYRYSGSIIMIVAKDSGADKAQTITYRILDRIKDPFIIDGVEQYAETAIGIAVYNDSTATGEDLYRAATLSLYRANEYGKNTFAFYNREFLDVKGVDFHLESELRRCIADNMRNFEVTFQPAYDSGGALHHYETLLRWKSEEIGSISPKLFMRLMEKVGLDTSIDLWVLPHACRFCKKMQELTGDKVKISVNLTSHEMQTRALPLRFSTALAEFGLEPENIIVEVPEAAHVLFYTDTAATLGKLKRIGINICIDSFGNEYLPLHVLKNSYIDMIKVNSSFVTNSGGDFDDVLLSTTFSLAASRDILICVKNIEYRSQYDAARNAGADILQGGLLSFPGTADELIAAQNDSVKALADR